MLEKIRKEQLEKCKELTDKIGEFVVELDGYEFDTIVIAVLGVTASLLEEQIKLEKRCENYGKPAQLTIEGYFQMTIAVQDMWFNKLVERVIEDTRNQN